MVTFFVCDFGYGCNNCGIRVGKMLKITSLTQNGLSLMQG